MAGRSPARKKRGGAQSRVQRNLAALVFALGAVLLALSLGSELLPTGNLVGFVGSFVAAAAFDFFGIAAVVLPVIPGVVAFALLEFLGRSKAIRTGALAGGLLLVVPIAIRTLATPLEFEPISAGWLGSAIGGPLTTAFGWIGASLLMAFFLAALFVVTVGWDPAESFAAGGSRLSGLVRRLPTIRIRIPKLRSGVEQSSIVEVESRTPEPELEVDPDPEVPDVAGLTLELPPEFTPVPVPVESPHPPEPRANRAAAAEPILPDPGDPTSADLPSTALLVSPPPRDDARDRRHLDGLGQVLVDTLATFKIDGEIVGTTSGPVVTQFEVAPAPGVKVARIANLEADLALAMRAASVRIVAPIPGKGAVGVEVPNPEPETVYFREVIESAAFRRSKALLPLALGKDLHGRPYVSDLARMPHLLIAGATGSGKSVCVNTIITSLVFRHSPRSLRLLMIDPKMVELSVYNDLPHLRHPVVTDNSEAAGVLKWAVLEMERRYALLSANNVRNLQDFNRRVEEDVLLRSPVPDGDEDDPDRWIYRGGELPYIVLIIDELADLMMTHQGDVEKPLALLAQKARAIGIHLILATQRPSVNVITGLIKANFPSRIGFRVSSKVDSRTILDQNGADALLGNGDMLFLPPGRSDPLRIQGAFLSTEETEALMSWYRERALEREASGEPTEELRTQEPDILEVVRASEGSDDESEREGSFQDFDALFRDAAHLCIQNQGGSTSLLQRRLRVGYGRAARIIDQLHDAGILGPADGSKPREVLVDLIQFDQMYPED